MPSLFVRIVTFSTNQVLVKPVFIVEPTNNVVPKKDGEKFEGWKVLLVPQNKMAWLTCQVTGYPVPRYL